MAEKSEKPSEFEESKKDSRKKDYAPRALRTILGSLKRYRFLGVLTAVTILVEAAMQIEIPTVMSNLIDFGIMSRSQEAVQYYGCLLYTSPSPRDAHESRMPSSA